MRKIEEFEKKVAIEYKWLLDNTVPSKTGRMPCLSCHLDVYPEYLALPSEPGKYNHNVLAALCFYVWDEKFDRIDGLVNAIKYNNIERLDYFKKIYYNVKIVVTPDFSQIKGFYPCINEERLFNARLVALWFTNELGAIIIPNMTYTDENSFPLMVDGLDDCNTVCFSAVSCLSNNEDNKLITKAIKYTVDHLNLDAIIVFTSTPHDEKIYKLFRYALDNNIKVIIPDNSLRKSNRRKVKWEE